MRTPSVPAEPAEAGSSLNRRSSRSAVAAVFFANGFVFASWVPHIPSIKSRLLLNDAQLGSLLLAMAVGAVVTLPVAGWLVGRFGSRAVTAITSLGFCAMLPLPVLSLTVPLLLLSLALFGALNAALDVAMNAQAVDVEKDQGRAIMSSFHGLFSLGGLAGAAATGFAMAVGLNGVQHSLIVAALSVLGVALVLPSLLPSGRRVERGPTFAKPTGILLGLGVMAFFGLLVEGAMADWSAVYLRDTLMTTPALASAGYAAFSLTMAVGRFTGDRLVSFWGPAKLLRGSGMLAASGLAVSLALHHPWAAITGFALVGLGASNVIPILFSAAGRVPGVQTGTALAAVATTGYFGFLAGPPLIGFMAELTNMTLALAALALCCAFIAVRAGILPCQARPEPAAP